MPKFTVGPRAVMKKYRIIAAVGASRNQEKEANEVPVYLREHGYTIIPVNPKADVVIGQKSYPSLTDIPEELKRKVEVVDVFRPSDELPRVAVQAVQMKRKTGRPFVFWGQLGLENEEAKQVLTGAKIDYIMDKCMKIEHLRMRVKRVNEEWHRSHPMPTNRTHVEWMAWHAMHAAECGCTPVPSGRKAGVEAWVRENDNNK